MTTLRQLHSAKPAHRLNSVKPAAGPATTVVELPAASEVMRAMDNPGAASPDVMRLLQQTAGNRAASGLVAPSTSAAGRPRVQFKLTVGPTGDHYEQEADRVADRVMRMDNTEAGKGGTESSVSGARQAQRKPLAEGIQPLVQRQAQASATDGSFTAGSGFESQVASRKGGAPMPEATRAYMEPRFGADFSGVRVHADADAARLNRSVQAQAFTHNQDIYFGAGQYNPASEGGKRLLAHELTHVVQQNGGSRLRRKTAPDGLNIQGGMPNNRLSPKRVKKFLDFVRIKQNNTELAKEALYKLGLGDKPEDGWGHWWIELGDLNGMDDWQPFESYGWWPSTPVKESQVWKGVPGVLNAARKGGNAKQDPKHGKASRKHYHPVIEVDEGADYKTVRQDVMDDIRTFANDFDGSWNWKLGWGKNCHTFLERMKKAVGMHHQKGKSWLRRPQGSATVVEEEAAKKQQEDDAAENSIAGPQFRLNAEIKAGTSPGDTDVTIPAGATIKVTKPLDFPANYQNIFGDINIRWNKQDLMAFPDRVAENATKI